MYAYFLIKMAAHNEINILCVYEYVFQIIYLNIADFLVYFKIIFSEFLKINFNASNLYLYRTYTPTSIFH